MVNDDHQFHQCQQSEQLLNTDHDIYDVRYLVPGLEQAPECGRVKSFIGIQILRSYY